MMEQNNTVDNPCIAYERMASSWDLLHDLLGGTKAMRSAGQRWLPIEENEKANAYRARVSRSFLYGSYKDTCTKLASKPFAKPITITDAPDPIQYLIDDVDGTDKTVHQLAYDLLFDMLVYGKTHIMVDFSRVEKNAVGEVASIAEEQAVGARAYLNHIAPPSLIGWKVDENSGRLTEVRIKETRIEQDEEYTQKEVNYVRVYKIGSWELWRETDGDEGKKKYVVEDEGVFTHESGITLVTIYANRTGFLTADPTLEELAWCNLTHWQSYSDQRNILRFSRFGMLFIKGITKKQAQEGIQVGPARSIITDEEQADAKYLEPTGGGITAGERDLQQLEAKMELLGNQPMSKQTSKATATAKVIDTDRNESPMQTYVRNLEAGLELAFLYAAQWHKIELKESFKVQIYSDFSLSLYGNEDANMLLKMRSSKELSYETYINELQKRGRLSEDVEAELEQERLAAELPNMADLLAADEDDDDDDMDDGDTD
jgi:hypothetical protein